MCTGNREDSQSISKCARASQSVSKCTEIGPGCLHLAASTTASDGRDTRSSVEARPDAESIMKEGRCARRLPVSQCAREAEYTKYKTRAKRPFFRKRFAHNIKQALEALFSRRAAKPRAWIRLGLDLIICVAHVSCSV